MTWCPVNQSLLTRGCPSDAPTWRPYSNVRSLMYPPHMKRLQIMIEEEVDAALERKAMAEGTSKAALIRRYVGQHLEPQPALHDDALWRVVGVAEGGRGDSTIIDEVVYGTRP